MSSHSQSTCSPSSAVNPPAVPRIAIFELNLARRDRVAEELETLRSAYLEWPTIEGLEAFVKKQTEFNEMMGDHIADLQAVTREQLAIVAAQRSAAKLAEERRLQEFQRALERMNPAEAEAARRAERERPFHIQRQIAARAAAFEDMWAPERERIRAKYSDL